MTQYLEYFFPQQTQIFKQDQTLNQAMDQEQSHQILHRLLKTAELFAKGYDAKRLYSKYDITNIRKTKKDLRIQFERQIATFQDSYIDIVRTYGKYQLPEDEDFEFIKNLIENWKGFHTNVKDRKLYDDIIEIFKNKRKIMVDIPYDEEKEMDTKDVNEVEMGNLANFMLGFQHDNRELEEKVKKEYNEKGRYVHKANLENKERVNKHLSHANMDMKRRVPNQTYGKKVVGGGMC